VWAQDPDSSALAVEGFLEVSPRLTRLHGQTSPMVQVAALIGFPGGWRTGGAGFLSLERVSLGVPPPLPELELHVGYGGLVIERALRRQSDGTTEARAPVGISSRLLIGGGSAEIRDAATGSRVRSDNFLALEPALGVGASVAGRVSIGVAAAYRLAIGVDGLQNIEEGSLRGASLGLWIRIGPF
jgi:hypothetical protein